CSIVFVSCTFFGWTTGSTAQERSPPNPLFADPADPVAPTANSYDEVFDNLRRMERRIDRLMKQNEGLAGENRTLAEKFRELSRQSRIPNSQGDLTRDSFFSNLSGATPDADDVVE